MITVASIWGAEKTAKTSLALTWPKPIRHFDFDMGFDRAAWRYQQEVDDGDIVSTSYPTPIDMSISLRNQPIRGYKELWIKFLTDYLSALSEPHWKTFIIDTATQCWAICHTAYLQELQEKQMPLQPNQKLRERLLPIEYAEPNVRMRAIEQATKGYQKHLVLCHYQSDVYGQRMGAAGIEDYNTGVKTLDGYKHTANLSDVVLQTSLDGKIPHAKVTLCGLSLNLVGVEMVNPSFEQFMEALSKLR